MRILRILHGDCTVTALSVMANSDACSLVTFVLVNQVAFHLVVTILAIASYIVAPLLMPIALIILVFACMPSSIDSTLQYKWAFLLSTVCPMSHRVAIFGPHPSPHLWRRARERGTG